MKTAMAYIMLAIVFGFSVGYLAKYNHAESGFEVSREPASKSTKKESSYDAEMSRAIRGCLSENVKSGALEISKMDVDGRNFSIISLDCTGDLAKDLYNAVEPYSDEQFVKYKDGRTGVGRFFGRRYPPSQCIRLIKASKGGEINKYSCSIMLDFDYTMIKNMNI